MTVARAGLRSCARAIGPTRIGRIPLPDVLLGDGKRKALQDFHSAEQDRTAALAVPDHRRVASCAGRGSGRELAPHSRGGIPFPSIAKRARDGYPNDATIDSDSGDGAPKEQHPAGRLLEHHAVLAAGLRGRTLAGAVGEGAGHGIPFPGIRIAGVAVLAGWRAPTEYDELAASRVKDHACARARARFLVADRGAVGEHAGRGIPFPKVLGRRQGVSGAKVDTLPTEHDQHLAGFIKGGGLQKTWVRAPRWGRNERPGGNFARGHNPQCCVG